MAEEQATPARRAVATLHDRFDELAEHGRSHASSDTRLLLEALRHGFAALLEALHA